MSDNNNHSLESANSPVKGILQKNHNFEGHEAPGHKLKWDESKLKATEKQQKAQVLMKVDEPNTPYIRFDNATDKVENWEDLPENLRAAHEEPEEFALDDAETLPASGITFADEPDEWQKTDKKEKRDREDSARKRHEDFQTKRSQHYYHAGDVLHETLQDDNDDNP